MYFGVAFRSVYRRSRCGDELEHERFWLSKHLLRLCTTHEAEGDFEEDDLPYTNSRPAIVIAMMGANTVRPLMFGFLESLISISRLPYRGLSSILQKVFEDGVQSLPCSKTLTNQFRYTLIKQQSR